MPIYKNKKIITIAIPKTACTSMYQAMKDNFNNINKDLKLIKLKGVPKRLGHLTLNQFLNYYTEINIKDYQIISIVRNPYDRFFSIYNHIKNANRSGIYTKIIDVTENNNTIFLTFNEWVLKINKIIHTNFNLAYFDDIHSYFIPQYKFLEIESNIPSYVKIFKFENIEEVKNNFKIKLPKLNAGNHSGNKIKNIYNDESKKIVYDLYKKDFEIFNYDININ